MRKKVNYDSTTDLHYVQFTDETTDDSSLSYVYYEDQSSWTDSYETLSQNNFPEHVNENSIKYSSKSSHFSENKKPTGKNNKYHHYHNHYSPTRYSHFPEKEYFCIDSKKSDYEKMSMINKSIERDIYHYGKVKYFDKYNNSEIRENNLVKTIYNIKNKHNELNHSEPEMDISIEKPKKHKIKFNSKEHNERILSPTKDKDHHQLFAYRDNNNSEEGVFKYPFVTNKEFSKGKAPVETENNPIYSKGHNPANKNSDEVNPFVAINKEKEYNEPQFKTDQALDTFLQGKKRSLHISETSSKNTPDLIISDQITKKRSHHEHHTRPPVVPFPDTIESKLKSNQHSQVSDKKEYSCKFKTNKKSRLYTNHKNVKNYQLNIDIEPSTKNVFEKIITEGEPEEGSKQFLLRKEGDYFYENCLVAKDKTKVNYNKHETKIQQNHVGSENNNKIPILSKLTQHTNSKDNRGNKRNCKTFKFKNLPIPESRVITPPKYAADNHIDHFQSLISGKKECSQRENMPLDIQRGSLDIPSHLPKDYSIDVADKFGSTNLRNLSKNQIHYDSKLTAENTSQNQTNTQTSRRQSSSQRYSCNLRGSLQKTKNSFGCQQSSQCSTSEKNNKNNDSLNKQKTVDLIKMAHELYMISKPFIDKTFESQASQEIPPDEALREFNESVFGIDFTELKSSQKTKNSSDYQQSSQFNSSEKNNKNNVPLSKRTTVDSMNSLGCTTRPISKPFIDKCFGSQASQEIPSDEALIQLTKSVFGIDFREFKSDENISETRIMPLSENSLFKEDDMEDKKNLQELIVSKPNTTAEYNNPMEKMSSPSAVIVVAGSQANLNQGTASLPEATEENNFEKANSLKPKKTESAVENMTKMSSHNTVIFVIRSQTTLNQGTEPLLKAIMEFEKANSLKPQKPESKTEDKLNSRLNMFNEEDFRASIKQTKDRLLQRNYDGGKASMVSVLKASNNLKPAANYQCLNFKQYTNKNDTFETYLSETQGYSSFVKRNVPISVLYKNEQNKYLLDKMNDNKEQISKLAIPMSKLQHSLQSEQKLEQHYTSPKPISTENNTKKLKRKSNTNSVSTITSSTTNSTENNTNKLKTKSNTKSISTITSSTENNTNKLKRKSNTKSVSTITSSTTYSTKNNTKKLKRKSNTESVSTITSSTTNSTDMNSSEHLDRDLSLVFQMSESHIPKSDAQKKTSQLVDLSETVKKDIKLSRQEYLFDMVAKFLELGIQCCRFILGTSLYEQSINALSVSNYYLKIIF